MFKRREQKQGSDKTLVWFVDGFFPNKMFLKELYFLMEEIRYQLISSLSHDLQDFIHSRRVSRRISEPSTV